MSGNDDVYCEVCIQDLQNQVSDLEKKVDTLEADIDSLSSTIEALDLKISDLKEILENCPTCSAILVAKNL
jgi:peptidoglycan hydrolase CwlO-like protein